MTPFTTGAMTGAERRRILWVPIGFLGVLLLLMGGTIGLAYLPIPAGHPASNIAVSVVQILVIALFLMRLRRAPGVARMAAVFGLVWASFLYLFSLADFLTR